MCEYSVRLVAWLDHELGDEETAKVDRHVGQCAECRQAVAAYEEVSRAFLACYPAPGCEESAPVQPTRKASRWAMGGVAAAAAILATIFFTQPRTEAVLIHIPSPPHAPLMAFETTPAPVVPIRWRRSPAPRPVQTDWIAVEPTVEVALPVEALFPPGAAPPGFSFIADVRP
jgi:hypothetical protein